MVLAFIVEYFNNCSGCINTSIGRKWICSAGMVTAVRGVNREDFPELLLLLYTVLLKSSCVCR